MYPAGFTLQGLLVLGDANYVPEPYQCYLFVVMIATSALLVNSFLVRYPTRPPNDQTLTLHPRPATFPP